MEGKELSRVYLPRTLNTGYRWSQEPFLFSLLSISTPSFS